LGCCSKAYVDRSGKIGKSCPCAEKVGHTIKIGLGAQTYRPREWDEAFEVNSAAPRRTNTGLRPTNFPRASAELILVLPFRS
jgi:hypothetical protein